MIGNASAEHRAMNVVNYVGFKLERLAINIDLWLTCCVILGTECNLSEPFFFFLNFNTYFFTFTFGCVGSPLRHVGSSLWYVDFSLVVVCRLCSCVTWA